MDFHCVALYTPVPKQHEAVIFVREKLHIFYLGESQSCLCEVYGVCNKPDQNTKSIKIKLF